MKPKFNLLIILFTFVYFIANAATDEAQKEFHESWPVNSVQTLHIANKFGEVKVNNSGGNEVTIDVIVTVEASSESRANRLLEHIDIKFSKSGSKVKAETTMDSDFKSREEFSIDYTVNIPSDKNLIIENKYGNVVLNELDAKGTFIIKYGNLTANKLNGGNAGDVDIVLEYGKATIETMSLANVRIKYSKIFLGEAGYLSLESKYSTINIDQLGSIKIASKYDIFNFEEVGSLEGEAKYSNFKIEELKKSLKISTGYGSIKVREVAPDFELIDITNSYGGISLGIPDEVTYDVDASCDYCSIKYDSDIFMGNRETHDHSKIIKGKIGSGESSGKVIVRSRYGGVKLMD